jgi:hypothetical protein
MERGLSILWIDAICGSVQNSMTPPDKNMVRRSASPRSTNGAAIGRYSRIIQRVKTDLPSEIVKHTYELPLR